MDYTAPKTDFPDRGDNFVTLGPWRIQSGATWHEWQLEAEAAHVRASRAMADELNTRRIERRRGRLKASGPMPVVTATRPTADRPGDLRVQPASADVPSFKLAVVNACRAFDVPEGKRTAF